MAALCRPAGVKSPAANVERRRIRSLNFHRVGIKDWQRQYRWPADDDWLDLSISAVDTAVPADPLDVTEQRFSGALAFRGLVLLGVASSFAPY
ncbi:MAG TPA: hypothetical protein VJX48_02185 [Xanthobacteraceae bacterium]|nr:hypothetical protein [Xanthobacteraceae bacterium]